MGLAGSAARWVALVVLVGSAAAAGASVGSGGQDSPRRGGSAAVTMTEAPPQHATHPAASRPQPLVRVPLVTPGDGVDPNGPPFVGVVQFLVAPDGFVRDARWMGAAPPAANAILARARRWVWEPARDSTGTAVVATTSMRVKSTPEALLIDRPDSTMGEILGAANYANVKVVDPAGKGTQRDMNPLQLAHVLADWISEDKAYAGPDPWKTRHPLHFDARIEFDGPGGKLQADFARADAWMQVTTKDRVLFVPYLPIRARIDEAFAKLFPDSSAVKR